MTHFQKPSSVDLQLYLERSTDRSCHLIMAEELKRNKDFQNQYINNFYFVFSTFSKDGVAAYQNQWRYAI